MYEFLEKRANDKKRCELCTYAQRDNHLDRPVPSVDKKGKAFFKYEDLGKRFCLVNPPAPVGGTEKGKQSGVTVFKTGTKYYWPIVSTLSFCRHFSK